MITIDPKNGLTMETIKQMVLVDYMVHYKGSQTETAKALDLDKKTIYNMIKRIKDLSSGKHNKRPTATCKTNRSNKFFRKT